MKIAVVHNDDRSGVLAAFGQPCPERYALKTIDAVTSALSALGHDVALFEGDINLPRALGEFFSSATGALDGFVFNLSYGIQGESRYAHVPAMLELAGVPYTGSTVLGHAIALDKVVTKRLLIEAGIPTPRFAVLRGVEPLPPGLRFPLVVKPRHESTSFGIRVACDERELREAVRETTSQYAQEALAEEYVDGREVCVALLGNDPPQVLPIVEQDFGDRAERLLTFEDKFHRASHEVAKTCPAQLPADLTARLGEIAIRTFQTCECRDYARVDVRIDRTGEPFVLEINSMASLGAGGSYVLSAAAAGYDFQALLERMVELASARVLRGELDGHRAYA